MAGTRCGVELLVARVEVEARLRLDGLGAHAAVGEVGKTRAGCELIAKPLGLGRAGREQLFDLDGLFVIKHVGMAIVVFPYLGVGEHFDGCEAVAHGVEQCILVGPRGQPLDVWVFVQALFAGGAPLEEGPQHQPV